MPFCATCYTKLETPLACGKCRKRAYCSRQCQKRDWKKNFHKIWCGQAGELNHDYEILPAGKKGMGVFAKRKFSHGDTIMVEHSVCTSINPIAVHPDAVWAVESLMPVGAKVSLVEKFNLNAMGSPVDGSLGLFLNLARVNHACLGNSDHSYVPEHRLQLSVAIRDIEPGEEITHSYVNVTDSNFSERRTMLNDRWNIDCDCNACSDAETNSELCSISKLDEELFSLAGKDKIDEALSTGKRLLELYDKHHVSPTVYARTYFDMYQTALMSKTTYDDATEAINRALESALVFYGEQLKDSVKVRDYVHYAAEPKSHKNFKK